MREGGRVSGPDKDQQAGRKWPCKSQAGKAKKIAHNHCLADLSEKSGTVLDSMMLFRS